MTSVDEDVAMFVPSPALYNTRAHDIH